MPAFEMLSEVDQIRSIKLAQIYFDHYPQRVITLMKEAKFAVPPQHGFVFRPEIWKSYHWGWFAQYSNLDPALYQLSTDTIPYYPVEQRENVNPNLWIPLGIITGLLGLFLIVYFIYAVDL